MSEADIIKTAKTIAGLLNDLNQSDQETVLAIARALLAHRRQRASNPNHVEGEESKG